MLDSLNRGMTPIEDIWSLLQSVRALRFEALSQANTGWNGRGGGSVDVSHPHPSVVIFNESGTWRSQTGVESRFSNVFRWTRTGDTLRLEHLRFGSENPVFLFDMAPNNEGHWREVNPHECRHDCYHATLRVEGSKLRIAWTIIGPRKNESIEYVYW